ncbi:MAG: hypothetical protein J5988_02400, partial [Eubacterium sp.]|nr:hypothetical protein [Eubacterium sp.]
WFLLPSHRRCSSDYLRYRFMVYKGYYYKHVFQLKRDMDAYEKASLTSEKSTLTSGTKLTVVKIQPMRRDSQGKRWSFVQVKTSAGKTVWVYDEPIDDYDSNNGYFQGEIPAWG